MGKKQSETISGSAKAPTAWVLSETRKVDSNIISPPNSSDPCPNKQSNSCQEGIISKCVVWASWTSTASKWLVQRYSCGEAGTGCLYSPTYGASEEPTECANAVCHRGLTALTHEGCWLWVYGLLAEALVFQPSSCCCCFGSAQVCSDRSWSFP